MMRLGIMGVTSEILSKPLRMIRFHLLFRVTRCFGGIWINLYMCIFISSEALSFSLMPSPNPILTDSMLDSFSILSSFRVIACDRIWCTSARPRPWRHWIRKHMRWIFQGQMLTYGWKDPMFERPWMGAKPYHCLGSKIRTKTGLVGQRVGQDGVVRGHHEEW